MADPISWAVIAYTSVKGAFVMAASSAAFAMGASAATSLTVGAAAASAFKFAGITALSIAANALFSPSVGASGSPTEWRSDPNAGLPFVAGRLGVAGNLIYSKEFGADNRYLGNVTLYSRAGPVHSMGPFYADGVNITFGSGGVATNGGNIANNMWLSSQDGLQPQPTALPLPSALSSETFTGWTANHKLSGCAADLQVLRQDSKFKTYPSGQPRRYRVIEGIKVYDPRLDSTFPGGDGACRLNNRSTYVYTTNAIIHALNWAIGYYENGKPVGGLADPAGPTLDGIDVEAFIAAANIADANAWTGLGARYSTADEKHQVLLGFLQAGGALYAENAGRISCVSRGAVKTSVMTLTRADTAGPVTVDAMPPRRVVINSLIPRCVQESYQWEPVDLEPVTVAAFVTADGGVRRRNKDFPFVTSSVQASQLAALDILDAREPLSGSTTFKPYVRDLKPGDAFTWNEPGFLLNGVKCVVMERSYDPASDTVEITWRSETDSKIAFALGLDPTPPVFPSVTPGNPSFVPVPSTDDWSATGGSIGNPGFVQGPVITLDGNVTNLTDVTHILVDFRASGDTGWTHHGEFPLAGFEREQILGLLPNTSYDIRLRYRNAWGVIDDSKTLIILDVMTGDQVVQDALFPSAVLDEIRERIDAAAETAPAAVESLIERFSPGGWPGINLVDAVDGSMKILAQSGQENLIRDPRNRNGLSDHWVSDQGVVQWTPDPRRGGLLNATADAADEAFQLRLWQGGPDEAAFEVLPGARLAISAELAVTGAAGAPSIEVEFLTAAGAVTGDPVTLSDDLGDDRVGGFVEPASIPPAARRFRARPTTVSTGAGDLSLSAIDPYFSYASPTQEDVPDFVEPQDERVVQIRQDAITTDEAGAFAFLVESRSSRAVSQAGLALSVAEASAEAVLGVQTTINDPATGLTATRNTAVLALSTAEDAATAVIAVDNQVNDPATGLEATRTTATTALSATEDNATAITSVTNRVGDVEVSADLFVSAYTDGEGNALAVSGFTLDVNGRLAGVRAFNDGSTSGIDFAFDEVNFGGVQIFTELNGGLLRAPNIEVENLRAGTVTADVVVSNSIGRTYRFDGSASGEQSTTANGIVLGEFTGVTLRGGALDVVVSARMGTTGATNSGVLQCRFLIIEDNGSGSTVYSKTIDLTPSFSGGRELDYRSIPFSVPAASVPTGTNYYLGAALQRTHSTGTITLAIKDNQVRITEDASQT